ncbi:gluconate 2-dehydrogenase subunit 3 family protein [Maribacter chungangensis]|uniref:Gluconate 2-dehydrogenase subunit 3 family protein n=1 Tax=Maribacter chungangensis TaxID=1069117 RepID=A0ABW3B7Z4_9FLAO
MDRRSALKKTGLLAGAAVAMPSILSILQGCKSEPRLTWQPEFFTEVEAQTIASLVDVILPRTDTPGALDVKVDVFIDKIIAKTYDAEGQGNMRKDIATFNADCKENYGAIFSDLDEKEKIAVLKEAEKTSGTFNPGIWGKTIGVQEPIGFYRSLKATAIWAYTTSEEIGEKVLNYLPVPGNFEGCVPVSEVGNKWSLG